MYSLSQSVKASLNRVSDSTECPFSSASGCCRASAGAPVPQGKTQNLEHSKPEYVGIISLYRWLEYLRFVKAVLRRSSAKHALKCKWAEKKTANMRFLVWLSEQIANILFGVWQSHLHIAHGFQPLLHYMLGRIHLSIIIAYLCELFLAIFAYLAGLVRDFQLSATLLF